MIPQEPLRAECEALAGPAARDRALADEDSFWYVNVNPRPQTLNPGLLM